MTQIARSFGGYALATTLASPITASVPTVGGTFQLASSSGYPSTNFEVVIDRGSPNGAIEEKIFISSRSGTTCTVGAAGRGHDGSVAAAHDAGAVIEHELDAAFLTAVAEHLNTNAGNDHATTLVAIANKGLVGDIQQAGVAAVAGASNRWADAQHVHKRIDAPSFVVYGSGTQSIANATNTPVLFDSESYDSTNIHSISSNTSRATIPSGWDGAWLFDATIEFAASATGIRSVELWRLGAQLWAGTRLSAVGAGDVTRINVCGLIPSLSAGDYVEVYVYQTSGGNLNIGDVAGAAIHTSFGGHWVRGT